MKDETNISEHLITKLYPGYFQKSRVFLYPLLSINKKHMIKPLSTYLSWENEYTAEDRKLITTFDISSKTKDWHVFQNDILFKNRAFERSELSDDYKTAICVFDFSFFKEDFDVVVKGKYSQMSSFAKSMIQAYYGHNTPEWRYMESFLLPTHYYLTYAELLDVEVDLLKDVGELTDKPDYEREILRLKSSTILSLFDEIYEK